ncbi:MAG: 4-(cytidine 5'-diphospho)-2-C-methyl-D-erythritol kinase [Undibacterium sp.]|nr:4-(cytidine 5'-diphospho)-2-C-methyl-D-erythritol kinase [Undibacterium sp.]
MPALEELLHCPAPAKLNLFLHIIGRRADGYHLLQSVFQLIDRCDYLDFKIQGERKISRTNQVAGVPEDQDLVIRAAHLLQTHCGITLGVEITLHKNLAMGGGLGGGSSDAATTLMALNHLWGCGSSEAELMVLGLRLGADVPFFIYGRNAFVEGIGEQIREVTTPEHWFVVIEPGVQVATPTIFSAEQLTRNTKPVRITDFSNAEKIDWKNDLQAVACSLHPQIQAALNWLADFGDAKMTGSGASVFCAFPDEGSAKRVLEKVPDQWKAWTAKALGQHPMKLRVS